MINAAAFVAGLMIGAVVGLLVAACCAAAGRADEAMEREERMRNSEDNDLS